MTLRRISSLSGLYDDSLFAPRTELSMRTSALGLLTMEFDPKAISIVPSRRPPVSRKPTIDRSKPKCLIPGCDREVRYTNLCKSHSDYTATCKHEGCTRRVKPSTKSGRCAEHRKAEKRTCYVNGCTDDAKPNGRCKRHDSYTRKCAREGCLTYIPGSNRNGFCQKCRWEVRR